MMFSRETLAKKDARYYADHHSEGPFTAKSSFADSMDPRVETFNPFQTFNPNQFEVFSISKHSAVDITRAQKYCFVEKVLLMSWT